MKVTGPGGPTPPTPAEGIDEIDEKPQVEAAAAATSPATVDPVALLARQIEAGAVTPQQAIEQVVHLVLNEQGVAGLPPAVRAEVRAALESLVEDDPYLAELLAGMAAR